MQAGRSFKELQEAYKNGERALPVDAAQNSLHVPSGSSNPTFATNPNPPAYFEWAGSLPREYPGAVTVRHSHELFKELRNVDHEEELHPPPTSPGSFPARNRNLYEIWEMILAYTICCPVLPSAGDNLINSLKLLTDDCELAGEYIQSERVRLRLREVCRQWKEILEMFSHRFVIITNDAHPPPLGSRVQYPNDCECRLLGCPLKHSPPSSPPYASSKKSIRAYIDISPTPERKLMDIVNQHDTLCLLATSVDLSSPDAPFSLSTLSHACQGLTHLSLSELYIPNGPCNQTLDLPKLHTLTLSFYCPMQSASPGPGQVITHPSFQKWNFPALQNLALKGGIWNSDPSFFRQINDLLKKVGPNLRGLLYNLWVFSPTEGDAPHPIPSALWNWCPKPAPSKYPSRSCLPV